MFYCMQILLWINFLDIERKKSKAVKKGDYSEVSKLCNSAGELLSTHGNHSHICHYFSCIYLINYPKKNFLLTAWILKCI